MKQRILSTVLVNTAEALERCLIDAPTVFCIEEPLFSEIVCSADRDIRFTDYDIHIHRDERCIILLRSAEPRPFDPGKHRFIYHPIIRSH